MKGNTHRREFRTLALWLMALIVALCLVREAAAVTVHLDAKDISSTVILHPGDRLRVELPSAPATGFRWKAKALDASHLELLSRDVRPDNSRLDTEGVQLFVWKALSPGHADLGLEYRRPGDDRTTPPAKRMAIAVEVVPGELVPAPAMDSNVPGPELNRIATYRGTLSCEGCTGIAVELALFTVASQAAGDADRLIFVERRRYQGAPGGDRTIAGSGKLAILHGTYADPAMTVYSLAAPDGSLENFKVAGDRLIPLDSQLLPLPPESGSGPVGDHALKKVADDAETGASGP